MTETDASVNGKRDRVLSNPILEEKKEPTIEKMIKKSDQLDLLRSICYYDFVKTIE